MTIWNSRPGLALLSHQRRLTSRFAARLGRSDAEDLASEAIARGLARPAPDGRQEPWIETIFRNLVADTHRRSHRRGDAPVDEPVDGGASPEEALLGREQRKAVASALPAIPAELREALVARFYDDQDYEQMAATRGISVTTARTRVYRALTRLRRSLEALRAWWPMTFGSGAPLSATWLPAVAVAVLAIGPSVEVGGARATTGAIISEGDTRAEPPRRASSPPPIVRLAAATQKRDVTARRPAAVPNPTANTNATDATDADEHAKPEAVKRLDFENDEVTGDLEKPGFTFVIGNPREAKLGSLIEIPRSLWPSMEKMVEDN